MIANNNDLHQSSTQFLYLTTKGRKTTRQHTIEIWFVEYNKRYYIISEHKKTSDWVQNIIVDSNVSFKVNNKTYMFSKYGWNDGLIVELTSNDNIK
jgi:hypothetical protein